MPRNSRIGTVYLLHFDKPVVHAQHYLGWAIDHENRVNAHLSGEGARLVEVAVARGVHVELVRAWHNVERSFERRLKKNGTLKRVCPVCVNSYRKRKRLEARSRRARSQKEVSL